MKCTAYAERTLPVIVRIVELRNKLKFVVHSRVNLIFYRLISFAN